MGAEKEAGVRVRLTGDDEVAAAASKISSAWGEVGSKATAAFKGMGTAVSGAVQNVLSDLGHVVTAAGAISFAGSVQQVERFEDSVGRLAVGSGRSFASVQAGINSLAAEIGEMPEATEAWVSSVGGLVYSYERAAQASKGLAGYAAQTGQSLQQVAPLAVILDQVGEGGAKSGAALAKLTRQAEMLGTVGGPRALGDMLQHLSGQVSMTGDSLAKTGALMAGFGGNKGFTPQQRERALGSTMSKIEGSAEGFERFLGHSITDEFGHVKDMTGTMRELQEYGKKGKGQARRLEYTLGKEATAALMHTNFQAISDAEKEVGSGDAGAHALARSKDTPAGRRMAAERAKDVAMQGAVGYDSTLGKARQEMLEMSAEHPLATAAGTAIGGNLIGELWKKGAGFFGGAAGGAAAAKAAMAGGGTAAAAGGGAGLGTVGWGAAAMGAGSMALAGIAAQFGALSQVGEGSAAKQGFIRKDLTADEAGGLAAKEKAALAGAAGNRSSGVQAAMAAEQIRIDETRKRREQGAAGPAAGGGAAVDPKVAALVDQMVKAGATLQLAQESAAALLSGGGAPIQIEIVNNTGGDIEARPRGKQ